MKPVLIFRHLLCEGPGYLADFLIRQNIPYQLIAIDQGDSIPNSLDHASALVFMGGPMSVNDDLPWIEQELHLIRQAHQLGMPVLGHCLGGQLIAKALGGSVGRNPVKEIGWHPVDCNPDDAAQLWLKGLPARFDAFHWHGETFELPPGATPLLSNDWCRNQAFAIGNCLGLQCHVEMTPTMVDEWCRVHAHEISQPTDSVQSHQQMLDGIDSRCSTLQHAAEVLYTHWISRLSPAD